ncbi:CCHC-type zinc finger nucleic acid binding protein [Pseudolycoriella hygida]|uniref:CCHC-type zinc finger nucleic acid binding protein n=1 Tax=Pseudolycoriella hygida TaxID=35572 RepID=A0A9Q0MWZ9_9DIPT|nr:CCHC-type zinc finger nucleic acid binding protein [Pseudolycoriella hygida]
MTLKDFCRDRGVSTSYRVKDDLVDRLNELDKNGNGEKYHESDEEVFQSEGERKANGSESSGNTSSQNDDGQQSKGSEVPEVTGEYSEETNLLEIHKNLVQRQKKPGETPVEYMYIMQKLGKGKIDERSMVEYVVDGIQMERTSKATLYEATTYEELKKKLRTFKITEDKQNVDTKFQTKNTKSNHQKNGANNKKNEAESNGSKERKCYGCGATGHLKNACPEGTKKRKCYNCNCYGHIAKDCRQPKKQANEKEGVTPVMVIETESSGKMMVPVTIKGVVVQALLDTGSPYTLMAYSTYKQLKLGPWSSFTVPMKGFAGTMNYSYGQCEVINDNWMGYKMLLGRNLLTEADVAIKKGIPVVNKIDSENDIMMIEVDQAPKRVEELSCVQEINNAEMRNEVMTLLLVDNVPVYQNPRRLSAVERKAAAEMIEGFIKEGIVRPKEMYLDFIDKRSADRAEAAQNIAKIQMENSKAYNKNRKHARLYALDELVAIARVKDEKGGKFMPPMVGPYRVTRVLRNDRYEVEKVGRGDGPMRTSVPADRMKPWAGGETSDEE